MRWEDDRGDHEQTPKEVKSINKNEQNILNKLKQSKLFFYQT